MVYKYMVYNSCISSSWHPKKSSKQPACSLIQTNHLFVHKMTVGKQHALKSDSVIPLWLFFLLHMRLILHKSMKLRSKKKV